MHSIFVDNIWVANLAYMQLVSKFNKGLRLLLCFTDIFSKCTWVLPLKDKYDITITNAFQKILKESNQKPKNAWVDKGREFCNWSMKSRLERDTIEIYSTYNEEKSNVAKRFIRTLKSKLYKNLTSTSKKWYIDA